MAETLNMQSATVGQIKKFIKDLLEMNIYDPVIVLGKMGMGKTQSLKELTKELGIGYCELRLVNMTETDMLGIPTISAEGTTTYASNDLLPIVERDGEVGILALDEITSCSSTMRAAAYQLLDGQRRLGNYKLPDKWLCVGLGNGPDDGGVFNGAEAALFTRCFCFRVEPDLQVWKEYAIANNINASIIAYLSMNPSRLHVYDANSEDGICPTPRTWEKASKLLNAREERLGGPLDINACSFIMGAAIGETEASQFSGFYKYNTEGKTINVEDVFSGKFRGNKIGDGYAQEVVHICIQSVIKEAAQRIKLNSNGNDVLTDENLRTAVIITKFFLDMASVRLDFAIIGMQDAVKGIDGFGLLVTDDKFDELCPEFTAFTEEHSEIFKAR